MQKNRIGLPNCKYGLSVIMSFSISDPTMKVSDPSEFDDLMNEDDYAKFCEGDFLNYCSGAL